MLGAIYAENIDICYEFLLGEINIIISEITLTLMTLALTLIIDINHEVKVLQNVSMEILS